MLKKFNSHSADKELTKYDGALCNVGTVIEGNDVEDVGTMYRVQFMDGYRAEVFEDELSPTNTYGIIKKEFDVTAIGKTFSLYVFTKEQDNIKVTYVYEDKLLQHNKNISDVLTHSGQRHQDFITCDIIDTNKLHLPDNATYYLSEEPLEVSMCKSKEVSKETFAEAFGINITKPYDIKGVFVTEDCEEEDGITDYILNYVIFYEKDSILYASKFSTQVDSIFVLMRDFWEGIHGFLSWVDIQEEEIEIKNRTYEFPADATYYICDDAPEIYTKNEVKTKEEFLEKLNMTDDAGTVGELLELMKQQKLTPHNVMKLIKNRYY